jgi:S-adenosylmethionine:diacylglycerol 3-amino-3-carboxypropyl transferase
MPDTPWQSGRFTGRGPKQILFGQMYEDWSIEAEAFAPGSRVFAIASAGCTAIGLAESRQVTAVDINPVQLEYARARADGAPVRTGSAERVMALGRGVLALGGWTRRVVEEFLSLDDATAQVDFWKRRLDTRRFRILFGAMLSGAGIRSSYSSPLHAVLPAHFDRVMRNRMDCCWRTHPNRTNPYARRLLLGEMPGRLPCGGAKAIQFVCADAAEYLESCSAGAFNGFTVSNILDGTPAGYRTRLLRAIRRAAAPQAVLIQRSFREPSPGLTDNLAARDRSFLWGIVQITPVDHLVRDLLPLLPDVVDVDARESQPINHGDDR